MLANPCGELRCSILSFLFSESSVRCFCHLKNSSSSPKSAPSVLCAGENPTFSSNLDEKGRKKLRAGAASAPGMYFLSCACRTRICLQVGNWVLLSSLSQSQFLQRISQSCLSGHSDVLLCLDSCLGLQNGLKREIISCVLHC